MILVLLISITKPSIYDPGMIIDPINLGRKPR
jgi:hypothetical protein